MKLGPQTHCQDADQDAKELFWQLTRHLMLEPEVCDLFILGE
jgi:hypothetical protein